MNDKRLEELTTTYEETASKFNTVIQKKTGKAAQYFESLKSEYEFLFKKLIDAVEINPDSMDCYIAFNRADKQFNEHLDRIRKSDAGFAQASKEQSLYSKHVESIIAFLRDELKLPLNKSKDIEIISEAINKAMHQHNSYSAMLEVTERKDLLAKLSTSLQKTQQHIESLMRDESLLSVLSHDLTPTSNIMTFKEDCRILHDMVTDLKTVSSRENLRDYYSSRMWDGLNEDDILEVSEEESSESINASLKVKHKKKKPLKDNDNLDPSGFLRILSCLKEGWDAVFTKEVIRSLPKVPRQAIFHDANEKDVEIEFDLSRSYIAYFVYVVEVCLNRKPNIHDYDNKIQRSLNKIKENNFFPLI